VRLAVREGFLVEENGKYSDANREAQYAIADELTRVEQAQKVAGQFHHDSAVEEAVRGQAEMMAEAGLSFADEWTTYLATDGARVSPPAEQFFASHGLSLKEELRRFTWALRGAVEQEVLRPNSIDPTTFLDWIELLGCTSEGHRAHCLVSRAVA
jgi:hypothetical protein